MLDRKLQSHLVWPYEGVNCTLVSSPSDSLTVSHGVVFRGFPHFHSEHDNFGGHGGHLVAEAVPVQPVHVSSKCVLATRLTLSRVDHSVIRACYLERSKHTVYLQKPIEQR